MPYADVPTSRPSATATSSRERARKGRTPTTAARGCSASTPRAGSSGTVRRRPGPAGSPSSRWRTVACSSAATRTSMPRTVRRRGWRRSVVTRRRVRHPGEVPSSPRCRTGPDRSSREVPSARSGRVPQRTRDSHRGTTSVLSPRELFHTVSQDCRDGARDSREDTTGLTHDHVLGGVTADRGKRDPPGTVLELVVPVLESIREPREEFTY